MKTIAQVLLSLALGLTVTVGLNADVRGRLQHAFSQAKARVMQVTDFATNTASNGTANASTQVSAGAEVGSFAGSQVSASASAEANGNASLGTLLNGILGQGQANADASVNMQGALDTSSDGSLFNLTAGSQGGANSGLEIGK